MEFGHELRHLLLIRYVPILAPNFLFWSSKDDLNFDYSGNVEDTQAPHDIAKHLATWENEISDRKHKRMVWRFLALWALVVSRIGELSV